MDVGKGREHDCMDAGGRVEQRRSSCRGAEAFRHTTRQAGKKHPPCVLLGQSYSGLLGLTAYVGKAQTSISAFHN
jgi:hypothetical protein